MRHLVKAAMRSPSVADLAWAAGIFEGEGSAGIGGGSGQMQVTQLDTWILYRLQEFLGGSVGGPYRNDYHSNLGHGRQKFVWYATGPRARGIAMTLFTFLSPRRRQQMKKLLAAFARPSMYPKRGLPPRLYAPQSNPRIAEIEAALHGQQTLAGGAA